MAELATRLSDFAPEPDVTIEAASDANEVEWDAFVTGHPLGTVDHLWRWRRIFTGTFGHNCVYLTARRAKVLVGVLPLVRFRSRIFGRSLVSVPFLNYGGVLAKDPAVANMLVKRAWEVAREFRAHHVELRHVTRLLPQLPCRQHKLGLARGLGLDTAAEWAGLDRKIRNQVRKAQKDGLAAEIGGAELVDHFYEVFTRNMRDLGTPVYPKQLFSETLRLFPEAARVFLVRSGVAVTAAAICLRFRETVLVPWASSLREHRHQSPNTLLYWTLVEYATQTGARVFDFGRSSPGSGPHQFKRQWGAIETPLNWEYVVLDGDRVPNDGAQSPKFAAAVATWKRLPLWLTNQLGPAVVRHLP